MKEFDTLKQLLFGTKWVKFMTPFRKTLAAYEHTPSDFNYIQLMKQLMFLKGAFFQEENLSIVNAISAMERWIEEKHDPAWQRDDDQFYVISMKDGKPAIGKSETPSAKGITLRGSIDLVKLIDEDDWCLEEVPYM